MVRVALAHVVRATIGAFGRGRELVLPPPPSRLQEDPSPGSPSRNRRENYSTHSPCVAEMSQKLSQKLSQKPHFDAERVAVSGTFCDISASLTQKGFCGMAFKAHDRGGGYKLPDQLGLGAPAMARRFRMATADRRPVSPGDAPSPAPEEAPHAPPAKRMGRPKVEGTRPWQAAGVSRRTWERRQRAKAP